MQIPFTKSCISVTNKFLTASCFDEGKKKKINFG